MSKSKRSKSATRKPPPPVRAGAAALVEPANVRKLADWLAATVTEGRLLVYYAERLGILAGLALGRKPVDAITDHLAAEHGLTFFQAQAMPAAQVLAILKADVKTAAAGPAPEGEKKPCEPLAENAAAVLEILQALPPGRAMIGPRILDALAHRDPPIYMDQSTLTTHAIPALASRGVKNKARIGYYVQR